ncbi:MAG: glycoside hydrolase family 127 protein [Lachnospiraceae bacterium]|nr:glycoside hydrolase family 127 protein [Lachnospiraceae bacterium]
MLRRRYLQNQTEIKDSSYVELKQNVSNILNGLDPDRILADYYGIAGIKKVDRYQNGFENEETNGAMLGQILKLLSILGRHGDAKAVATIDYLVDELAICQEEDGYLSAKKREEFYKSSLSERIQMPWYPTWTLLEGLLYCYFETESRAALEVAKRLGLFVFSEVNKRKNAGKKEFDSRTAGGLNGCFYLLFSETGDGRYLDAAEYFDDDELLSLVKSGADLSGIRICKLSVANLNGRLIALSKRIVKEFDLGPFEKFFKYISTVQSYANGGFGDWEQFVPKNTFYKSRTNSNAETCSSAFFMQFCRNMYLLTGDGKYTDYYEKLYYNALIPAIQSKSMKVAYFTPMASGNRMFYGSLTEQGWCCVANAYIAVLEHNENTFSYDDNTIFVDMYMDALLNDTSKKVRIENEYKQRFDVSAFKIHIYDAATLKMAFRVPCWQVKDFNIRVNGKEAKGEVINGYFFMFQSLKTSDYVEVFIKKELYVKRFDRNPKLVSFMYGPFLLGTSFNSVSPTPTVLQRGIIVPNKIDEIKFPLEIYGTDIDSWEREISAHLRKDESEMLWQFDDSIGGVEVVLAPFYMLTEENYGVYFKLVGNHADSKTKVAIAEGVNNWRDRREKKAKRKEKNVEKSRENKRRKAERKRLMREERKLVKGRGQSGFGEFLSEHKVLLLFIACLVMLAAAIFLIVSAWSNSEKNKEKLDLLFFDNLSKAVVDYNSIYQNDYTAGISKIDDEEYLCFFNDDIRVFYRNAHSSKKGSCRIIVDNTKQSKTFDWDFTVVGVNDLTPKYMNVDGKKILILSFYDSIYSSDYVVHAVDLDTLEEIPFELKKESLNNLVTAKNFIKSENKLMLLMSSANNDYYVKLNPVDKPADVYFINEFEYLNYKIEETSMTVEAYLRVGSEMYVGKAVGRIGYKDGRLVINELAFCGFSEGRDDLYDGKTVITPIKRNSLLLERNLTKSDAGGFILIEK